jgi:hypothetical protein
MRTVVRSTGSGASLAVGLVCGSYSSPEDFEREGLIDRLARRGEPAHVVMAEMRAAYFADCSVAQRLREHVVRPALERGARRLWLAGVSLGALACLGYAAREAARIEHLVLLSPYPGTRELLREIEAAGGPTSWSPGSCEGDPEREAWAWLRARGSNGPRIDCYYGTGDRFLAGQRRMAECLPAPSVHEGSGGHGWEEWRAMWDDFLERNPP